MIITQKDFSEFIENEFAFNNMTIIETVLYACEKFSIDPNMVEPLINRSVKEKMKQEFIELNFLKKENNEIV